MMTDWWKVMSGRGLVVMAAVLILAACSDEEDQTNQDPENTNQIDPNQTDPNQTDPNQTDPNQTDPNQTDPNQTDPNHDQPAPDEGPFDLDDPESLVPFQPGVDRANGQPGILDGVPGADEVRLGRIEGPETSFSGIYAHCREGDFLLSNSEIVVCIQSETTNRYETYTGGKLVDARRHDQPDSEDVLDMVLTLFDFGTASAEKVEVVRDGSDGLAVLRVSGQDVDIAHLTGLLEMPFGQVRGVEVVTEYRLQPGSSVVEIASVMTAPDGRRFNIPVGDWFLFGDRAQGWTPGFGLGIQQEDMSWVGAAGSGHSFGLIFDGMAAPMGLGESFGIPWAEMRSTTLAIGDGEEEPPGVLLRWFVVGDGTLDSVRELAAQVEGEELPGQGVTVTLVDEVGAAVEGAQLVVRDGNDYVTFGETDENGEIWMILEEKTYQVEISRFAGPLEVERDLVVSGDEATVAVPATASVTFSVTDADKGEPLSSRIGLWSQGMGTWQEYALKGTVTTRVPATEVVVTATRGIEYNFDQTTLELQDGADRSVELQLQRALDTEGWRSGDFHQHMEPSLDSRVRVDRRVKENVTQGVELMVPTDHDVVTDVSYVIERLGLTDEISSFPGVEISPLYAHFNLYPMPYRPDERGRGTFTLSYLDDDGTSTLQLMPEIIASARELETDPIIQMNHPRNNSGMMAHIAYDPNVDDPDNPEDFRNQEYMVIDIDAIEVINRYGDVCQVLADWSGLLNSGRRVTGLGNSDTHNDDGEAGEPRNFMVMDVGPGEITPDLAREALRNQRVSVASHTFVDFTDGTYPGDTVAADANGRVSFEVRVQTPGWAQAESFFVIVNGEVVQARARGEGAGAYDFHETIELDLEEDSWVIFWADGPRPNAPIPRTKQVIGFTNPVFVTTGDGPWQAPGVRTLDLDAIDTGYCG